MKKLTTFAVQVIVTMVIYSALICIFNLIGGDSPKINWQTLLQSFIFAILYVPLSRWWTNRRTS